jgi:hypothetical protein
MMNVPKIITPIGDASLGDILPGGESDLPISLLPYVSHAQPTSQFLYDTSHPIHSFNVKPGDFVVPYGEDQYAVLTGKKGFLFQVIMMAWRWIQRTPEGKFVPPVHNTQPKDLDWVPNPASSGKKICIASSTGEATTADQHAKTANRYDRQTLSFMLIEGRYPAIFCFASTARERGDALGNRVGRWAVNGKPAPMLGLFRMASEPASDDQGHHWFKPKWVYVAKHGETNGPNVAWTRRAAELRRALKEGDALENEAALGPPDPVPESPPAIEKPAESPPSLERPIAKQGSIEVRSGKVAWDEPPREQAPPPASEDDYGLDDPSPF